MKYKNSGPDYYPFLSILLAYWDIQLIELSLQIKQVSILKMIHVIFRICFQRDLPRIL